MIVIVSHEIMHYYSSQSDEVKWFNTSENILILHSLPCSLVMRPRELALRLVMYILQT